MWRIFFLLTVFLVKSFGSEESEAAAATDNYQVMLDILRVLPFEEENVFFSPLSISVAFGMVSLGAGGNTLDEISNTFGFDQVADASKDPFAIHKLFEKMITTYRNEQSNYTIRLANRLFPKKGFSIKKKFLDETEKYYKSSPQEIDFASEKGEEIINDWVEKETNDKIKNLFAPQSLTNAVLVLVNAIYFKGNWLIPFRKDLTYDDNFSDINNKKSKVKMMTLTQVEFSYLEDPQLKAQVLNLPYDGDSFSMVIVLPEEGNFLQVISQLTSKKLRELLRNTRKTMVNVKLPKFKLNTKYSLVETLQKLGIKDLFDSAANLTGIADGDLLVSEVVHQAFVAVDEEGTEAAAATGVVVEESAALEPEREVNFFVDRPFIFSIIDNRFRQILFTGTVVSLSE